MYMCMGAIRGGGNKNCLCLFACLLSVRSVTVECGVWSVEWSEEKRGRREKKRRNKKGNP